MAQSRTAERYRATVKINRLDRIEDGNSSFGSRNSESTREDVELIDIKITADSEAELREKLLRLVDIAFPERDADVKSEGNTYRG